MNTPAAEHETDKYLDRFNEIQDQLLKLCTLNFNLKNASHDQDRVKNLATITDLTCKILGSLHEQMIDMNNIFAKTNEQ